MKPWFALFVSFFLGLNHLCSEGIAAKKVRIALLSHDTKPGIFKPMWSLTRAAAFLALDDYRPKLLEKGLDVSFQEYTEKEEPIEMVETIKNVLAGNTLAGIGLEVSAYAAVGGKALEGSDYVIVSPYASSGELLAYYPNLLLISALNNEIAAALERFIKRQIRPWRIVAIVSWDQNHSKNFFESFSDDFRKAVPLFKVLEHHDSSEEIAPKVMALTPDAVLLPNLPGSSAPYIKALAERGYRGVFLGSDTWGEDNKGDLMQLTSNVRFQGYTVRQYTLHNLSPSAKRLKERLAPNKSGFRIVAMLYYDAVAYLLERLIDLGPNASRKSLLEAVKKQPVHRGTSGKSCFGSKNCPGVTMNLLKVDSSGYRFYKSYDK